MAEWGEEGTGAECGGGDNRSRIKGKAERRRDSFGSDPSGREMGVKTRRSVSLFGPTGGRDRIDIESEQGAAASSGTLLLSSRF